MELFEFWTIRNLTGRTNTMFFNMDCCPSSKKLMTETFMKKLIKVVVERSQFLHQEKIFWKRFLAIEVFADQKQQVIVRKHLKL